MDNMFRLVLSLSLSGSVLILLMLALRPLLRNKLSKTWQYYLWIIVLLRLALPLTPSFGLIGGIFQENRSQTIGTQDVLADKGTAAVPAASGLAPTTGTGAVLPVSGTTAQNAAAIDIFEPLGIVWLAGAALILLLKSSQYAVFTCKIRKEARPIADIWVLEVFRETSSAMGLRKNPALLQSAQIASPMLIGLFKPVILLPESSASAGRNGLPYVFRHELTHLRRRDILYKWVTELILCVHWFNPLAYLMMGFIAEICELSCDETVARCLTDDERLSYGRALLDSASEQAVQRRHLLLTTLREDKISIKERLITIVRAGKKSKITVMVSVVLTLGLVLAAVVLGACSAGGTTAAQTVGGTPSQNVPASASAASSDVSSSSAASALASSAEVSAPDAMSQNIVYKNTQYGFNFTLPNDWKGYTLVAQQWNGTGDAGAVVATGPELLIRSPKWTAQKQTQDIPIMVFSNQQWADLQQIKFTVSAAPILPSELGRNTKYIFALPARYDYAYLPGYQEVEQIISQTPLTPTESISILPPVSASPSAQTTSADIGTTAVIYKNTDYGFDFYLPQDWAGYTIVSQQWKGNYVNGSQQAGPTGPEILIRNPKWTTGNPMQDIPIMVFTIDEWNAVLREELAVSAAPIPPSELGQNSKFVFALPARYNFAFPDGYQEVDQIIQSKPLHANENFK